MPRYYDDMGNDVTSHVQSLETENARLKRENEALRRETGDLEAKIRKTEKQMEQENNLLGVEALETENKQVKRKRKGGKKQDAI